MAEYVQHQIVQELSDLLCVDVAHELDKLGYDTNALDLPDKRAIKLVAAGAHHAWMFEAKCDRATWFALAYLAGTSMGRLKGLLLGPIADVRQLKLDHMIETKEFMARARLTIVVYDPDAPALFHEVQGDLKFALDRFLTRFCYYTSAQREIAAPQLGDDARRQQLRTEMDIHGVAADKVNDAGHVLHARVKILAHVTNLAFMNLYPLTERADRSAGRKSISLNGLQQAVGLSEADILFRQ